MGCQGLPRSRRLRPASPVDFARLRQALDFARLRLAARFACARGISLARARSRPGFPPSRAGRGSRSRGRARRRSRASNRARRLASPARRLPHAGRARRPSAVSCGGGRSCARRATMRACSAAEITPRCEPDVGVVPRRVVDGDEAVEAIERGRAGDDVASLRVSVDRPADVLGPTGSRPRATFITTAGPGLQRATSRRSLLRTSMCAIRGQIGSSASGIAASSVGGPAAGVSAGRVAQPASSAAGERQQRRGAPGALLALAICLLARPGGRGACAGAWNRRLCGAAAAAGSRSRPISSSRTTRCWMSPPGIAWASRR